jgi:hypothetical protein
VGDAHPTKEKIMRRVLAFAVVLGMVSFAMADVGVFEPASDAAKHNASYDNLYRPGNAIWALRQYRLANPEIVYPRSESPLLDTMSMSTTSSAEVARPIEAFNAANASTFDQRFFRMSDLMKAGQPATAEEESNNPVFLGVRPNNQNTPEPNRHIVIEQLNPKGADKNPARAGEVIIKPYDAPAKRRPVR